MPAYPNGISLQIVSSKGPLPKCGSCNLLLDRGESRVLHKFVKDAKRGHMQQDTYPDVQKCLIWMSKKQKQALVRGGFESNGDEGDREESAHINTESGEEGNAIGYQSIDDVGVGAESNDDGAKSSVYSVEYGTVGTVRISDDGSVGLGPAVPMQGDEEGFEFEELDPSEFLVLGPGEFLVESILERRPNGKKHQYLVKWVGYDKTEDNTWESGSGLPEELVTEYNQKFPLRRPLRR